MSYCPVSFKNLSGVFLFSSDSLLETVFDKSVFILLVYFAVQEIVTIPTSCLALLQDFVSFCFIGG